METVCVGIDTGGTFTDLVAVELTRGRHKYHKVPTPTADPAKGVLDGIAELARPQVSIATRSSSWCWAPHWHQRGAGGREGAHRPDHDAGFRDVLELARQRRPHYFNLDILKPMPPAPRDCRLEVAERVAPTAARWLR